jgi:hypothetical protein
MHLFIYERALFTSIAVHVRQLPQNLSRAHPALRVSAASARAERYANDHPASALPYRRSVPRTSRRNARDGQHQPDANSRNHGSSRLDHSTPRQRSARTLAASIHRWRSATPARSAALGQSSISPASSDREAGLDRSSATHALIASSP